MAQESFWVISYDIKDDRRRLRVAKTLEDYGKRVQYSVFECILKEEHLNRLKRKLERLIKNEEDSIRYYKLCNSCKEKIMIQGQGKVTEDEEFYII
jgi:CRISPR-associated protein Cas2